MVTPRSDSTFYQVDYHTKLRWTHRNISQAAVFNILGKYLEVPEALCMLVSICFNDFEVSLPHLALTARMADIFL